LVVGAEGIEPPTFRLIGGCSTPELLRRGIPLSYTPKDDEQKGAIYMAGTMRIAPCLLGVRELN